MSEDKNKLDNNGTGAAGNGEAQRGTDGQPVQAKKPRKALRIVIVILLALLVVLIAFVLRMYYVMTNPASAFENQPTPKPVATPSFSFEPDEAPDPEETPEPTLSPEEELKLQADMEFIKDRVNILMLGMDISPERLDTAREDFRTDVMMLLSIDFANNQVYLASVPRDSLTKIYNSNSRYKINGAFAIGGGLEGDGFEYAKQTMSILFGDVPVPYYAAVQMDGLKKVVDAMGGVNYDVDVEIRLNGRVLEKGYQKLNGQQVLDYCRARKGISTDVGRIDRQQRMLFEIFRQMKSTNQLVNLPKIFLSVQDSVYTDLNVDQIAALAAFALNIDPDTDLHRYTLEGEYAEAYSASYYLLYQSKRVQVIKEIFGIDVKPMQQYDASFIKRDSAKKEAASAIASAKGTLATLSDPAAKAQLSSAISSLQSKLDGGADFQELKNGASSLLSLAASLARGDTPSTSSPPSTPSTTPGQGGTDDPDDDPVPDGGGEASPDQAA